MKNDADPFRKPMIAISGLHKTLPTSVSLPERPPSGSVLVNGNLFHLTGLALRTERRAIGTISRSSALRKRVGIARLQRIGPIGLDKGMEPRIAKLRDVSASPYHSLFEELDLLAEPRVLDSVDVAIGYTARFDGGKMPRGKGFFLPHAPRTFASQLVIGTKYFGVSQIETLRNALADTRVKTNLGTTDHPPVRGVLALVSDS